MRIFNETISSGILKQMTSLVARSHLRKAIAGMFKHLPHKSSIDLPSLVSKTGERASKQEKTEALNIIKKNLPAVKDAVKTSGTTQKAAMDCLCFVFRNAHKFPNLDPEVLGERGKSLAKALHDDITVWKPIESLSEVIDVPPNSNHESAIILRELINKSIKFNPAFTLQKAKNPSTKQAALEEIIQNKETIKATLEVLGNTQWPLAMDCLTLAVSEKPELAEEVSTLMKEQQVRFDQHTTDAVEAAQTKLYAAIKTAEKMMSK